MGIRNNVAFLHKKNVEVGAVEDGALRKSSSSLKDTKKFSRQSLSLGSPIEKNLRQRSSITLMVTSPTFSTKPVAKFYPPPSSGPAKTMAQVQIATKTAKETETEAAAATDDVCELGPEFRGDARVSTSLPSRSTLDKIADASVYDLDGRAVPFKSLYWPDSKEKTKVMIIFIRHFFCGNCQEYLRTLSAAIPPASLPSNTSIRVIGCGSHTLIPSYLEQTRCPYQIFADPSKKLYDELGMARTLSLGSKDPDYIRHTLVSGIVKSIAQGLKRIGSGDVLQAGDMKQVGGEFLFEVSGPDTIMADSKPGNRSLEKVEVTWCHRMKNTRDHAEVPELKKVVGSETVEGEERRPRRKSGAS